MNEHIVDLLPFYLNQTLASEEHKAVREHLASCFDCRSALVEWAALSNTLGQVIAFRTGGQLPSLSPIVRASMRPRPPAGQMIHSAANLIWAQRVFLRHSLWFPAVFVVMVICTAASLVLQAYDRNWLAIPMLILVPIMAALVVAYLHYLDSDPALEVVATTPTSPVSLIFARLTLALWVINLLAALGSLLVSILTGQPLSWLIGVWLGPMLLLSALSTILSLIWNPWIAASATLTLWAALIILLVSEQAGTQQLPVSLMVLLHPDLAIFGCMLALAGLLWLLSWVWLTREANLHQWEI